MRFWRLLILIIALNTSQSEAKKQNSNNLQNQKSPKIYNWRVLRVVDGDTLEIANEFLPAELKLFVRIAGIDTPEKPPRSKCLKESMLAQQATNFTKNKIQIAELNDQQITFDEIKWDKYGGRILARVKINEMDLGEELINQGLARRYYGEKKRGWCQKN